MDTDIPKIVKYGGRTYRLQTSGRYYQDHNRCSVTERLLHRKVWIDQFGPIPEGYEVHHKDGDWTNNSIDNLECLCGSAHASLHMKERWANPLLRGAMLENIDKIRDLTKAWHASDEGRKWHSSNSKLSWEKRPILQLQCAACGSPFESKVASSKWCNVACWQRHHKDRKFQMETRNCVVCGKSFEAKKHTKNVTCNLSCRGYLIAFKKGQKTLFTPTTPPASI